jgi:DNA-binding transcriptional LysR family regulator
VPAIDWSANAAGQIVVNTDYPGAIFAYVNDKAPRRRGARRLLRVFSAVSAGTGVALTSDTFIMPSTIASNSCACLPRRSLGDGGTPEPKRIAIGPITRKRKLSPATEKFCQCAKEASDAIR